MTRTQWGMTVGRTPLHVVYHVAGKEQKSEQTIVK